MQTNTTDLIFPLRSGLQQLQTFLSWNIKNAFSVITLKFCQYLAFKPTKNSVKSVAIPLMPLLFYTLLTHSAMFIYNIINICKPSILPYLLTFIKKYIWKIFLFINFIIAEYSNIIKYNALFVIKITSIL